MILATKDDLKYVFESHPTSNQEIARIPAIVWMYCLAIRHGNRKDGMPKRISFVGWKFWKMSISVSCHKGARCPANNLFLLCFLLHVLVDPLFADRLETALRGRQSMVLGETRQFTMPASPATSWRHVLSVRGEFLPPCCWSHQKSRGCRSRSGLDVSGAVWVTHQVIL